MTEQRRRADLDDTETEEPQVKLRPSFPRCIWKTGERQCLMVGCMSPDIGEKRRHYCHWHYVCLSNARWATDEEEFRRWLQVWAGYCSPENHYEPASVWDAILGIAPLSGKIIWCGGLRCRHFDLTDTLRWVGEREHKILEAPVEEWVPF